MSFSRYGEFLAFAIVIIVVPGPDFAVVMKNTLVGGGQRGGWTAFGVSSSNLLQGMAAATGLSAIIMRAEPVFQAIKWAGVCYLAYLGIQAVRSAIRGEYTPLDETQMPRTGVALAGWRQGFVSNITNPKVLVFFLAVLPQFLPSGVGFSWVLLIGSTFSILGMAWLLLIVAGMHGLRTVLDRRKVRRSLDATTGAVLLGFSAKLATEHV
ncbi:MAG TPA: LysE family translocator [Streptosporangiaceae bacterium]